MKRVMVDGEAHDFPDDATEAEISQALNATKGTAEPAKRPRTWTDTAVDLLPAAGGMAGGIAGSGIASIPMAMAGGAVGEGARLAINRARGVETPSSAMDVAKDIGTQGAIQGAAQGVGMGIGRGIQAAGETLAPALMQSALKPGMAATFAAIKSGRVPPVVQTLLDEGVNVSHGGISALQDIIGATNTEIKSAINSLPAGSSVNPMRVAGRLSDAARRAFGQVNPQADLDAISEVGQNFLAAHGGQDIPVAAAQELKTGTYKALGNRAYGELKSATIEGEKALARGLKEEIASLAQSHGIDLTQLNLREGKALDALDAVVKRVATGGNANPLGLAGIAVSAPKTFITMLIDKSPVVKSMLARGLYQSAGYATGVAPQVIRAAVAALVSRSDDTPTDPNKVIDPGTGQPLPAERTAMR